MPNQALNTRVFLVYVPDTYYYKGWQIKVQNCALLRVWNGAVSAEYDYAKK